MAKHLLESAFPEVLTRAANVIDVAEALLAAAAADGMPDMSTMKLQKLVYLCQGWHMAATGKPMFPEKFEAWASGPVCRELYELHQGEYTVAPGFFYAKIAACGAAGATQSTTPTVP